MFALSVQLRLDRSFFRALLPSILGVVLILLAAASGVAVAADPADADQLHTDWRRAIANDRVAELRVLLETAADPDSLLQVKTDTGKNVLMIACKMGDLAFAIQLLDLGMGADSRTATGGTPLMFAALGNHLDVVDHLLKLDVDVNAQGSNGWSSLTIAAAKGYAELAAFLVASGARVNARDVYRWTPMMRAVDNEHMEVVRLLVDAPGSDLDNQDEGGNTALHYAVATENSDMIKLLLDAGANPGIDNFRQQTPAQLAATLPVADKLVPLFPAE